MEPEVIEEDEFIRKMRRVIEELRAEVDARLETALQEFIKKVKEDPDFLRGAFTV
mgnify:CR=1 FL=1